MKITKRSDGIRDTIRDNSNRGRKNVHPQRGLHSTTRGKYSLTKRGRGRSNYRREGSPTNKRTMNYDRKSPSSKRTKSYDRRRSQSSYQHNRGRSRPRSSTSSGDNYHG